MSASVLRTLMIAMIALIFGAQQIACACPPAHDVQTTQSMDVHASHSSDHTTHKSEHHDHSKDGTCSHCESGSFLTAAADKTFAQAVPKYAATPFVVPKSLRLATYSPTDSPKPVIRDDALRRFTPIELKVRLLN